MLDFRNKENLKKYSIKVFNTKNTMKSLEALSMKRKVNVKPQIFGFKHELLGDRTTQLLESPMSSNRSNDSYKSY